jgi:coenzyme F420-reducing hydrogenase delta subunit
MPEINYQNNDPSSTTYQKTEADFRHLRKASLFAARALRTKCRGQAAWQFVKSFAPGMDQLMLAGGKTGPGGLDR